MDKFSKTSLRELIANACRELQSKLDDLDISSVGLSEYNRTYLARKTQELKGTLQLYGRILHVALRRRNAPLKELVLVDYGGGIGLISLLTSQMGVGTVVYNDIYDVSCEDAERLANSLNLRLDHIVCGDADRLVSYAAEKGLAIDAIVSYDVIEHIYNLETHFSQLAELPSNPSIVYASTANKANPRIRRMLAAKQRQFEVQGRDKQVGHKERDSLRPYLTMRREIIAAYASSLAPEIINSLARNTRGLIKRDIEAYVDEFQERGEATYSMDHPTNTCDPLTGNWCEHLLDFAWLKRLLKGLGFASRIVPGHYHSSSKSRLSIRCVKVCLNLLIRIVGRGGLAFAPYYILVADRRGSE